MYILRMKSCFRGSSDEYEVHVNSLGMAPKLSSILRERLSVRPDDVTRTSPHLIRMSDVVECNSAACQPELLSCILENLVRLQFI